MISPSIDLPILVLGAIIIWIFGFVLGQFRVWGFQRIFDYWRRRVVSNGIPSITALQTNRDMLRGERQVTFSIEVRDIVFTARQPTGRFWWRAVVKPRKVNQFEMLSSSHPFVFGTLLQGPYYLVKEQVEEVDLKDAKIDFFMHVNDRKNNTSDRI